MTSIEAISEAQPTRGRNPLPDSWKRRLSPGNISIVYLYVAGFILFSLWVPELWLDQATTRNIANISFAVPALVAVGLVVPLLGGAFDLSIAGVISATSITVSWLMVVHGWHPAAAIAASMLVGVIAGVINGLLVVKVGINSFIATLGTNAVLSAYAEWRSGGIQISGFSKGFLKVGTGSFWGGYQYKVLYLLAIALLVWYVIEHRPAGRYLQATGDNEEAARLAGVATKRYVFGALVVSASVASMAGIVQTATVGGGSATLGNPFLLSAFAAAFLGSTQFKGRFNVWGTVAAVWVLVSGVQGVTLAYRSFPWLNDLFFGTALLVAVGMAASLERLRTHSALRRRVAEVSVQAGRDDALAPPLVHIPPEKENL